MGNLEKEEVERNKNKAIPKRSPIGIIILLGVGFISGAVEDFEKEPVITEFCRTRSGISSSLFCWSNPARYNRIKSGSTGMTLESMKIP